MSGNARDEILARVRTALADRPTPAPVARNYVGPRGPGDVGLFAERARDYRALVRIVPIADIPATIDEALAGHAVVVAAPGLPSDWAPTARRTIASVSELDSADGVITACHTAIAETGTIILDHDAPDQGPRALTLIPDYHLVVVRRSQLVAGVPDAVMALAGVNTQTWISGPSATSDIELERVEGVHGPRTLEILMALD